MTKHGIDAEIARSLDESGLPWQIEVTDRLRIVVADERLLPGQVVPFLGERARREAVEFATRQPIYPGHDAMQHDDCRKCGTWCGDENSVDPESTEKEI